MSSEQIIPDTYTLDIEPIGRRIINTREDTLLNAAQIAGLELTALCGGEGWCGKCRIKIISGQVTPYTTDELTALSATDIAHGIRLACQVKPLSDVVLEILPETLTTSQRLQLEGSNLLERPSNSLTSAFDITLTPPSLTDLTADSTRIINALQQHGINTPVIDLPLLQHLSDQLRQLNWNIRIITHNNRIAGIFPPRTKPLGLAIDFGSTKIAAYLVDLEQCQILAKQGAVNPQVAYGEDVVSRIAYANQNPQGRKVLQEILVEKINELIAELCQKTSTSTDQIIAAVAVGNTVIHHLFLGLPLQQLGEAPYIPTISTAVEFPARELNLNIALNGSLYMPPNIAAYVGADHVAMLLAANILNQSRKTIIALDIGTNTEISLYSPHKPSKKENLADRKITGSLYSCSCASGPAFEGAHIHDGMRAIPGAIEHVQFRDGKLYMHTIDNKPPLGICGSGILDAVSELYRLGIVDSSGRLKKDAASVRSSKGGGEYILVPADQSGSKRDILVTRRDINEIQLAKGAIRAGIEVLLHDVGLTWHEIDEIIIAGAFGTYLDIDSAVRIGMFPSLPKDKFVQIGNAAGMGAIRLLLSQQARQEAEIIAQASEYIELTIHPSFRDIYLNALNFE